MNPHYPNPTIVIDTTQHSSQHLSYGDDPENIFDANQLFKIRKTRQDLTSKVLLITIIRTLSLSVTAAVFLQLGPDIIHALFAISTPVSLVVFLVLAFSWNARTIRPRNAYLFIAYVVVTNIFCAVMASKSRANIQDPVLDTFVTMVNPVVVISLCIDYIILFILVKYTRILDVKDRANMAGLVLLIAIAVHVPIGGISGAGTVTIISVACSLALGIIINMLILRSAMCRGWFGPENHVAAAIYTNDLFIYLIALCTDGSRMNGRQEQLVRVEPSSVVDMPPPYDPEKTYAYNIKQ